MRFEPRVADAAVNVTEGGQLGEFGRLVVGFFAAGFALLVMLFLLVDVLVRFVDADLENRLFAGRFPIGEAPAAFGEPALAAQALLARLQTHWPDSPYRFELRVADEDEPNAVALPGGTVVVTRGLLEAVESENELAFVLGHELGHFHGRDHLRGMGRGVVMAATLAVVGLGTAGDLGSMIASATVLGFGREQERTADSYGLSLLLAEYGHAAHATRFFERLEAKQGERGALEAWVSTHPLSAERVRALRTEIAAAGAAVDGEVRPLVPMTDPTQ